MFLMEIWVSGLTDMYPRNKINMTEIIENYSFAKYPIFNSFGKGGRHLGKPCQIWNSPNPLSPPPPPQNFWIG